MRIGILTIHLATNPGAFFQAMSTQRYLENLGFESVIVNYQSPKQRWLELAGFIAKRSFKMILSNLRKRRAFQVEQKSLELFPVTATHRKSKVRTLSKDFDIIIIGSDIVWSHETRPLGNLDLFFGEGLSPRRYLVSYAASMGPSHKELPAKYVDLLSKFDYLSVRDEHTRESLEKIGLEAQVVLDPTLLANAANLVDRFTPTEVRNRNFVLVYCTFLSESSRNELRALADRESLEIVVCGYPQKNLGLDLTHLGPKSWLNLFHEAKFVVTDTFHGTIFSLLSATNFVTLDRAAIRNKALNLLSRLHLERFYSYTGVDESLFSEEIDWDRVELQLSIEREKSIEFLRNFLSF
mgnify:CR=1 FL=1